jgi:hypothetical protein
VGCALRFWCQHNEFCSRSSNDNVWQVGTNIEHGGGCAENLKVIQTWFNSESGMEAGVSQLRHVHMLPQRQAIILHVSFVAAHCHETTGIH